jgi:carboxypeptidase C (cathepsin A)
MATPKKRKTKSSSSSQRRTSKTRNDYLVRGLEKVVPAFGEFRGTMYAGLIPTTPLQMDANDDEDVDAAESKSSLMFWLFAPHEPIYTDSMVVWMNGGPGCSSLGGSLFEQGPVTIPLVPAGQTTVPVPPDTPLAEQFSFNPYTWTQATAMLYLEHPVGTGFSINDETTPLRNETDVGRDVYNFLQNFYTIFGRPTAHDTVDWGQKDLYLIGESYAGMYVPSIAHYIHQQNTRHKKGNSVDSASMSSNAQIPLAGIAMGNGWMNALVQGPAVIDYAWWHGMIDSTTKAALHQEWDNCKMTSSDTDDDVIYRHHHHSYQSEPKPFHRFTVPDECGILEAVLSASGAGKVPWGAPNAYDVTTWDE